MRGSPSRETHKMSETEGQGGTSGGNRVYMGIPENCYELSDEEQDAACAGLADEMLRQLGEDSRS
jgi:hypothetical protein